MISQVQQKIEISVVNNNNTEDLKNLLRSLLNQSWRHLSIHIRDIGSNKCTDDKECFDLIQSFPDGWQVYFPNPETKASHYNQILNCCYYPEFLFYVEPTITFSPHIFDVLINRLQGKKNRAIVYATPDNDPNYKGCALVRKRVLRYISGFDKHFQTNIFWEDIDARLESFGFETLTINLAGMSIKTIPMDDFERARIEAKKKSEYFGTRILHIDSGLGDHVMALGAINSSKEHYVCCKTPGIFENQKNIKGIIPWDNDLWGSGQGFNVYEHGQFCDKHSIIESFCSSYEIGYKQNNFYYTLDPNLKLDSKYDDKSIVVVSCFSAQVNGNLSNKNWDKNKWELLCKNLQNKGYYVIQVGSPSEEKINNVDEYFLGKTTPEVAKLLSISNFFISCENYVHHLASSIKKKGIVLHFPNNEHAKHDNYYIEKKIDNIQFNNKWFLDSMQPERKIAMMAITVEDVMNVVLQLEKDLYYMENFSTEQIDDAITNVKKQLYISTADTKESVIQLAKNIGYKQPACDFCPEGISGTKYRSLEI